MDVIYNFLEENRKRGIGIIGISLSPNLYTEFLTDCKDPSTLDTSNCLPVRVTVGNHSQPIIVTHTVQLR